MIDLKLFDDYDRRNVHDIFEPETLFTPSAGTWGLPGIIPIKDRPGDFVLFVTFGRSQGEHEFDEGISDDGVLRWQSQPSQTLQNRQIRQLVDHDETRNQVYLFLRTSKRDALGPRPYTYLGRLKYLTHDIEREMPVHFAWQLLDWPLPQQVMNRIGLTLELSESGPPVSSTASAGLVQTSAPKPVTKQGTSTREFKARFRLGSPERDRRIRDLGLLGEIAVLNYERLRLVAAGRSDLADQVRHVSLIEGDGAGYDILSFRDDGSRLYIEVKTTIGDATTDFFISPNEVAFSEAHPAEYELRRVFNFNDTSGNGSFFSIVGKLAEQVSLSPTVFRAAIR